MTRWKFQRSKAQPYKFAVRRGHALLHLGRRDPILDSSVDLSTVIEANNNEKHIRPDTINTPRAIRLRPDRRDNLETLTVKGNNSPHSRLIQDAQAPIWCIRLDGDWCSASEIASARPSTANRGTTAAKLTPVHCHQSPPSRKITCPSCDSDVRP